MLGSVTRSLIRRMPPKVQGRLRSDGLVFAKTIPDPDWVETIFLTNMSTDSRFDSQVNGGWTPPVDRAASLEAVLTWLDTD